MEIAPELAKIDIQGQYGSTPRGVECFDAV
jgi:hypothetical protein